MKTNLLLPFCGLLLAAICLQSCAIDSQLIKSEQKTVVHEHRVHLPAAMYTAGSGNTPFLEKKGDLVLATDCTWSGKDSNDDKNKGASQTSVVEGVTHQKATSARTFSVKGGYALTDHFGIIGNATFGKNSETYMPYIESWNIKKETYYNEYWLWLPMPWNAWNGITWTQTDNIQTVDDYKKISKDVERSYRYADVELGAGIFAHHRKWKTEVYGGLGFARNTYNGHLDRDGEKEAYGRHSADFYKIFAQPAVAFSTGWLETGAALKGSFMRYNLKSMAGAGGQNFERENGGEFFIEPSLLLRFGPRACRLNIEHKWLVTLDNNRFPTNAKFFSIGLISAINTNKK